MKFLGWVFLIAAWGGLSYWTAWCLFKIWTVPFDPEREETDEITTL